MPSAYSFSNANSCELVLPQQESNSYATIPAETVTKIALRLKHQIETVIPCELEEELVTKALSPVLTPKVVDTSREAGGKENGACVIFCLLICKHWFLKQAKVELWDADLHEVRAVACEVIAKRLIESEKDQKFLQERMLLQRFSIVVDGEDSPVANAIEKAVDFHALIVIGSSGYQKCVSYLWRGWIVQSDSHPAHFTTYKDRDNTSYWAHLDPDRIRVPLYQNALQVTFSIIFLALYTGAINTINPTGDLDMVEVLLYVFTLGFIFDEIAKLYKVGRFYISFWNCFNSVLYVLLTISFVTRMIALSYEVHSGPRKHYNEASYNFLAFTAPMFWMRLMLYLDSFRFMGTMLVVVKIMMKESLLFFALLMFVLVGFFQAFLGLDQVDESIDRANFIAAAMSNAIMSSPDFGEFNEFAYPFGIILYYIFCFIIMVVLLNVLIALYNSAYEDTTSNSTDEFMALFAQKCLEFTRAPDENVFIPPLNIIEVFGLVLPFEWWMPKHQYAKLNDVVMWVLYWPLLIVSAFIEQRDARRIKWNRGRGEEDEDTIEEWEQLSWKVEDEDPEWCKKVQETSPDVSTDAATREVRLLKKEVDDLRSMVSKLLEEKSS